MFGRRRIARVFTIAAALVLASRPGAYAQEVRADLNAALHDAVRLAPDAPAAAWSALVTDSTGVVFDTVATAPGVLVALVAPSGTRYTEATIGAIGGVAVRQSIAPSGRTLINPTETPGHHVTFTIPTPLQGTWRIELPRRPGTPPRSPSR